VTESETYIHKGQIKNDQKTSETEVNGSWHQMAKIGGSENQ